MKKDLKIILIVIVGALLITGIVSFIIKVNDSNKESKKNNEAIMDMLFDNLHNTLKITIEDTYALEKKVYTIIESEEINKITNILSNIKPALLEETDDTSRFIIKLYDKENIEYANLSFYPIKIKGYNGKLTLGESGADLYKLLNESYSATFREINNNVEKILAGVSKIEVRNYNDNKLIKTIKDNKRIKEINNIILNTKVDESRVINDIGLKYNLVFLNKEDEEVAKINYAPYLLLTIDNGKGYHLINYDFDALSKLIEK